MGTISIVTGIMDRLRPLRYTLPTYAAAENISEIIIADWSSKTPVIEEINRLRDEGMLGLDKVRVIRVEEESCWNASACFNVACFAAKTEYMIKLDADVLLTHTETASMLPAAGTFFAGNWQSARNQNEISLNGSFSIRTNDLFKINGYDERYPGYGYEDADLYVRLAASGLQRREFERGRIFHLPHLDYFRTANTEGPKCKAEGSSRDVVNHNMVYYQNRLQWSRRMRRFKYEKVDSPLSSKRYQVLRKSDEQFQHPAVALPPSIVSRDRCNEEENRGNPTLTRLSH